MATLQDAVKMLEAGNWEGAHLIAQADDSRLGSWAHGIVHVMEGDMSNAEHWYRKAGRDLPDATAVEIEIATLSAALND